YDELFEDVARRAPDCPVFIAPATPMGGVSAPEFQDLVTVVENARDLGLDVRVLPQVHRMLGIA
ncbi:MAG: organic radical activating enzyme, partial [Planctomycetota bacterium]